MHWPGDPRGLGAGEESDQLGHLFGLSDPTQRDLREVVVQEAAAVGDGIHQLGGDDARLDRVDPDAPRAQLVGGDAAQHVQTGLGRSVDAERPERVRAGVGRHADDRAAALRQHGSGGVLDRQEGADVVELDRGPDRVELGGDEGTQMLRPTGAGEDDVEASAPLDRGGNGLDDVVLGVTSATT